MRMGRILRGGALPLLLVLAVPAAAQEPAPAAAAFTPPDIEQVLPLPWAEPAAAAATPAPSAENHTPATPPESDALRTALQARLAGAPDAIASAYAARDYAPLWIDAEGWTERARAARARIARADEDGLDAAAFRLPAATLDGQPAEARAGAEIALTEAALAYARTAWQGRLKPSSVSAYITAKPPAFDPAQALAAIVDRADIAATLDGFNPPHAGFQALRRKLAELRAAPGAEVHPVVPEGRLLRPGMSDPRVPVLRRRLGVSEAEGTRYDGDLVDAVKAFQTSHRLSAEGIVGPQTIGALNGASPEDQAATVIANMERWRWLPRDLGASYILVNIPEYQVRVLRDGKVVHRARVIVGKPTNQTPVFSHQMDHLIVNPSWNVPTSIAVKEMLPMLRKDPAYLAKQGIEVVYVSGRQRTVIDSTRVDWNNVSLRGLHFRQPPGERNALGHIKFMFPNEHAVYLHDTPGRALFQRSARAFSHGCVRVQDPFALADVLLQGSSWNGERVRKLIGTGEKRVNLPNKIPIHLVYFTAMADGPGGALDIRADIYGHDRAMKAALGLDGRIARVAGTRRGL